MFIQAKNNVQNRMKRALGKRNFKSTTQQDQQNTQLKPCFFVEKNSQPNIKRNLKPGEHYAEAAGKRDISLNAVTAHKHVVTAHSTQALNFIDSESEENYSLSEIS